MDHLHGNAGPPISSQREFWNQWNAQYRNPGFKLPPVNARQAEIIDHWVKASGRCDLDILEVGCGSGWMCERLMRFGRVTGTDLADEMIEQARHRCPGISFVAGDFLLLDLVPESADVVVSLEVLAHVSDQPAFICKIARALRPNGCLMLATQNRSVLEHWDKVPVQAPSQIRNWVNHRELRRLLCKDFEIVELVSIVPIGNQGILRFFNSSRLMSILAHARLDWRFNRLMEYFMLGHTLMVKARKR